MKFASGPTTPLYPVFAVLLLTLLTSGVRLWFQSQGIRWIYILLCAGALSAFATPLLIRLAPLLGAMDLPDERKIHAAPTPRLGGLAIYSGFVIAIFSNAIFTEGLIAILVAGTLLLVVGVIDDVRSVPASIKLGAQLGATTLVIVFSGKFLTLFAPGPVGIVVDLLLTYLWVVGITNAFNFFDGMDGLATGLAAIIAFFMGVVAFQTHQPILGWLSVAIVGSSLGFLPYNFRLRAPAVIFLGEEAPSWDLPWPVWR
jgi:UDP-GlcNAc:undecaprenyl-phosphate GlcNAc-1-phosphate transferase